MLGGQAGVIDHRGGAARPDQSSRSVGDQKFWIPHPQRTGERAREDAQQRNEAAEEDRPHSPAREQLFGQRDMAWAEGFGNRLPSRSNNDMPYRRPIEYPMVSPMTAPRVAATPTHTGLISSVWRDASNAALTSAISPGNGIPRLSMPITAPTMR